MADDRAIAAAGLPTRRLGRTGLDVTVLGLGGAPLGDLYEEIPETRASETIATAHRLGIRLFDTSPVYGLGLSEHRFGHVLRDRPSHDFALSTKVGRYLLPEEPSRVERFGFQGGLNMRAVLDYGYDATLRAIDQSFQRLGLERIDILYIHDVDARSHGGAFERVFGEAMAGAYRALAELRASGTVGAIGIGVHDVEACLRFAAAGDFDAFMLAGPYTLLDQTAGETLLPLCLERGISVVIGGPFSSGILATGAASGARYMYSAPSPEILDRVGRIEAVCASHDVPLAAAALQFPLGHPAIAAVVAGAVSPEEVGRNVQLVSMPIPAAFWDDLASEGLLTAGASIPR